MLKYFYYCMFLKNIVEEAGEIVHLLRALIAFAEDLVLVSSTHIVAHNNS